VAVSGGGDSVGLLRLLLELCPELGILLSVIHFNHELRGAESDADAEFVAGLAREHKLPLHSTSANVAQRAKETHLSIEAAARQLRYQYFAALLGEDLHKIATGHTLDDQAETVLLRLIRGTGMRGLRAIQPRLEFQDGEIIRPLLGMRRSELEQYLQGCGQPWRDDTTNRDPKFTRNRVRQLLLPLLERDFNPAIAENLAELAEIARGEEDYWENEISGWMGTVVHWNSRERHRPALVQPATGRQAGAELETCGSGVENASLDLGWLRAESLACQRRVIKAIGDSAGIPLEHKHVGAILRFADNQESSGKQLVLPRGWRVVHDGISLEFRVPVQEPVASDFEYCLSVPGEVTLSETGTLFQAVRILPGSSPPCGANPAHLFDPKHLSKELVVRNWRPGDRFWPAHTKSPKKIKELLQERHVAQPERRLWPVVLSGNDIVWVRGFRAPARLRAGEGQESLLIREVAIGEDNAD